jgi:hypothetical protein
MISYDLNNHEKPSAYQDVADMIKKYAIDFKKPLKSQWFVETRDSVDTWHDRMKNVTDSDDAWFIIKVQRPYAGWLSKTFWPWLNDRI